MRFRRMSDKLLFSLIFLKCLSLFMCNKPKLTVISGQTSVINNKTVINIRANATLRLKCEGMHAINWSFPENDPYSTPIKSLAKINSRCVRHRKCFSEMSLQNLQYWQTGQYSCYFNKSKNIMDSIYVFVNDQNNLIVPVEGNDEFLIVFVRENSTQFLIECKPTDSRAVVSLHLYEKQTESFVQMTNDSLEFDPTVGFIVTKNKYIQYDDIDCRVKLGQHEQYITVTTHTIRLTHSRLYPSIDVRPNITRIGDNITLNCLVNIPANTYISDISWHFDKDYSHKWESTPVSVTKQSSEGVFETVSRSLTIFNATDIDSGLYSCNVTDISEGTYSISKRLVIGNGSPGSQTINKSIFCQFLSKQCIIFCYSVILFTIFY